MTVLYVSKALVTAAYRDKLRHLARHVRVEALIPSRWGRTLVEPTQDSTPVHLAHAVFHGKNHFHFYPSARRIMSLVRPTLVHIDEEPYSLVTLQLARLCERSNVPFVFFAWQNILKRLPWPFEKVRAAVYRSARAAIAGTSAAAEVLRKSGFDGRIAVIPQFGIDPERFAPAPERRAEYRKRLGIDETEFVVLFAGRFRREKGIHDLLRATRTLSNTTVTWVGSGPAEREITRHIHTTNGSRCVVVGPVSSTDMPGWYNAADVTVLPSRTTKSWVEQFGRCLVESMACGTPVIGSDSGEIPRVIGGGGVVVPEGQLDALREALQRMRDDAAFRRHLAAVGRRQTRERFTNQGVAEQTWALYSAVTGGVSR